MWETVMYLVGITNLKSNRGSPRKAEDALFFGPVVPLLVATLEKSCTNKVCTELFIGSMVARFLTAEE